MTVSGWDNIVPNNYSLLAVPFYEAIGGIVHDVSKYSNAGTLNNCTWTQLPSGIWCLSMNGVNDWLDFGNPAILQVLNEYTILFWANLNSVQASAQFANPLGKDYSGTQGITLQIDHTSANSEYWHIGNGASLYSINYDIPMANFLDNQWHLFGVSKGLTHGMSIWRDGFICGYVPGYTLPTAWGAGNWYYGRCNILVRITTMYGGKLYFINQVLTSIEHLEVFNRERARYGV